MQILQLFPYDYAWNNSEDGRFENGIKKNQNPDESI